MSTPCTIVKMFETKSKFVLDFGNSLLSGMKTFNVNDRYVSKCELLFGRFRDFTKIRICRKEKLNNRILYMVSQNKPGDVLQLISYLSE